MTQFFKKYNQFINEGIVVDLTSIFVSAIFGKSAFEYKKVDMKLCIKGIDSILNKAFKEFDAGNMLKEDVETLVGNDTKNKDSDESSSNDFDKAVSDMGNYVKALEEFLLAFKEGEFKKNTVKYLLTLLAKLDPEYFSPEINLIIKEHKKDFSRLKLVVGDLKVTPADIDKKFKDLDILKENVKDLTEDEEPLKPVITQKEPEPTQEPDPVVSNPVNYGGVIPSEDGTDNVDEESPEELGEIPMIVKDAKWSKSKKEAATNYLIEKYKVEINDYLVSIAKIKFVDPKATVRVEYNKKLEEMWKDGKQKMYDRWKEIFIAEKLNNLFEVGIKMTTTQLHDDVDTASTRRILANLPLIEEHSLEKGISLITPGNYYMGSEVDLHNHPTNSCVLFYVPADENQNQNSSGFWVLPIAKVKFRNLKYKIEEMYLTNDHKQDTTRSIYFLTNSKANINTNANKMLLLKVTPGARNYEMLRSFHVKNYDVTKKEKNLSVVSPIFRVSDEQMQFKFKLDKSKLKITSFPNDKEDIENKILVQQEIKK